MSTLNRRITLLFVVVNLVAAGVLSAQDFSDTEVKHAVAVEQAEVEQTKALVAALAAPEAPSAPAAPVIPTRTISFKDSWPFGSGGASSVLVIPTAELKMEELVTTTEDMSVMSRIFEKNLEQAHLQATRGTFLGYNHNPFAALLGGGGGVVQSMYLQGYAALFLMKMDFPLSPPLQAEEKQEEETQKEGADAVWQEMRKEMYEPREATGRKTEQPEEKYDAEKVENLKTTLVKALKHAANVRNLKQDELVILAVAGSGKSAGGTAMITTSSVIMVDGNKKLVQQQPASHGSSQTVLVIRAKKSDIDSFAKNALDYEQFRQRIQLFSCPCLGPEAGRGDPFGHF